MRIFHVVVISSDVALEAVERVKADLLVARTAGAVAFEALELGTRIAPQVRDGVFDGRIRTGDGGGDHVLVVTLNDEAALEAYYRAPAHSSIRERFLSAASPEIAALYAKAAADPSPSAEHYEAIEHLAEGFMKRLDLSLP